MSQVNNNNNNNNNNSEPLVEVIIPRPNQPQIDHKKQETHKSWDIPVLGPLMAMGSGVLFEYSQAGREAKKQETEINKATIKAQVELEKERLLTQEERSQRLKSQQEAQEQKRIKNLDKENRTKRQTYTTGLNTWSNYYCSPIVPKEWRIELQHTLLANIQSDYPKRAKDLHNLFRSTTKDTCGKSNQFHKIEDFIVDLE